MKKLFIILSFAFAYSTAIVGCGSSDKSNDANTEEHEHAHVYQCPMDCEEGKTYDKEGSCPVCKMDLEVVEH